MSRAGVIPRMRILHLTPELPYAPGGTGGATRQYHLLRRLVERGHEVTVVAPLARREEPGLSRLREAGIRPLVIRRPGSRILETVHALAQNPALALHTVSDPVLAWQVGVFWTSLRKLAAEALAEQRPDVLSIEHDYAVSWAADLPMDIPKVLDLQNVSWHYYERRAVAAGRLAARGFAFEAARFRKHGLRHFHRYATLIAVSERDRDDLVQATGCRVELIPNGVATDELTPRGEPERSAPTLLFTGTMNHPPNAEGILWFAAEIWPRILERQPETRLLVVGREPPEAVRRLGRDPRITVTGAVPEIAPYFERATAVVVPLRSGGGTRLKILEALAAGRPLVSTSVGAEGIDVKAGRDVLLEDDPARFAQAAVRLLEDADLGRRLAASGRATVEKGYDWRALGDRLEAVLAAAASDAASGSRNSIR